MSTNSHSAISHKLAYRLLLFFVFTIDFIEPEALRNIFKAFPYVLLGFDKSLRSMASRRSFRVVVMIVFFLFVSVNGHTDNHQVVIYTTVSREVEGSYH